MLMQSALDSPSIALIIPVLILSPDSMSESGETPRLFLVVSAVHRLAEAYAESTMFDAASRLESVSPVLNLHPEL